jgi:hypothetical protein
MTALTGTNVLSAPKWQAGLQYTAVGYYTLGGAIVSGDTITWTNILPGTGNPVKLLGFRVWGQELDTNASPTGTLKIGDANDDDGYLTSKTAGDATGQMQFFGDGAYIGGQTGAASGQASASIIATVGGTLATAASSGTIWIAADYFCQNS